MLSTPVSENKTKGQQGKTQSESETEGYRCSGGWVGYGSLSLESNRLAPQSQQMSQKEQLTTLQKAYGNQALLRRTGQSLGEQTVRSSPISQVNVIRCKRAYRNSAGSLENCSECQQKHKAALIREIQTKLTITNPSDQFEIEADRLADQVMRMPDDEVQSASSDRKSYPSGKTIQNGSEELQAKRIQSNNHEKTTILSSIEEITKGYGQPLDKSIRNFMESRFGHDFSQVRIHNDTASSLSAKSIQARAYTYRNHVFFDEKEFNPNHDSGRRLIAHELAHVVQQGYAPSIENTNINNFNTNRPWSEPSLLPTGLNGREKLPVSVKSLSKVSNFTKQIARDKRSTPSRQEMKVGYVAIYLGKEEVIDFHTSQGLFRYHLDEYKGLNPGEYEASVVVKDKDVEFSFNVEGGNLFKFRYRIDPGKPNPSTFFGHQTSVTFTITTEDAPPINKNKEKDDQDSNITYLSIEEALRHCESGDLPGVKVFPYRGTRFGGAPITAHQDGEDIIVKLPIYVLANSDFKTQTHTLPLETFIGGVRLKSNEIVRVHTYEPRWYHLNITGSTSGDIEEEYCVTGEQMLQISERSDRDVLKNIGLTVLDAATFFVPVGRLAAMLGRPVAQVVGRGVTRLTLAIMLALRDVAPTAFAGIASRTSTVLIEEQVVDQVASRAISQTASYATIQFSEKALEQVTSSAVGKAAVDTGTHAAGEALARTVTVTVVDAAGHKTISTLTTPTGDKALDDLLNQAFDQTFNATAPQATGQSVQQGVVTVAPEITAGFTQGQVQAFRRFLGKSFTTQDINVLAQLWNNAARAGDNAILNASNSRYLFDLQRNRFWARVASNPQARAIFTDAGCQFSGGAPYYMLNGRRITITIDHIIERQSAPNLALTASNLRLSFSRENSVVLRLLNQLDPFQ